MNKGKGSKKKSSSQEPAPLRDIAETTPTHDSAETAPPRANADMLLGLRRRGKQREQNEARAPLQGHHIINKDCITLYKKILEVFVDKDVDNIFYGKSFGFLKEKHIINDKFLPNGFVLQENPLQEVANEITEMTADEPQDYARQKGNKEVDKNAENYGVAKVTLLRDVHSIMSDICSNAKKNKEKTEELSSEKDSDEAQGDKDVYKKIEKLSSTIEEFFTSKEVYIDLRALHWRKKELGETKFDEITKFNLCKERVEKLFKDIAHEEGIQLVVHWGQWAFRVSEGLRYGYVVNSEN